MNTNVMPSIVQIEKENLRKLVTEVKETLATDMNVSKPAVKQKRFGIVDMWNCKNKMRTAASLRKF